MPLNTRAKKRENVEGGCEYAIHPSTAQGVKLNIPQTAIESETTEATFVKAHLIDISVSGCGIDSEYLIPPGVILDLKIDQAPFVSETKTARTGPIRLVGRVTSCIMKGAGHYRLGIFFTSIDQNDTALIDAFIKSKERRKDTRWDMSQ